MTSFSRMLCLCGLFVAACAGDGEVAGRPLDVGGEAPPVGLSGTHPAVVWVVGAEAWGTDALDRPAAGLRALQRRFEGQVEVVVVAVGDQSAEDETFVSGFLTSEGIDANLIMQGQAEYERVFGDAPIPALYVIHNGVVVEVVDTRPSTVQRMVLQGAPDLEDLIARLLEER